MTPPDSLRHDPAGAESEPVEGQRAESARPQLQLSIRGLLLVSSITLVGLLALRTVDATWIHQQVAAAGPWAPVLFVLLKIPTLVFAPLSGAPLNVLAGSAFGVRDGLLLTVVADTIGGSLNFAIARTWGWRILQRVIASSQRDRLQELSNWISAWQRLLWARVFLTPVYDLVSYSAGLSEISYKTYVVITLFGAVVPNAFLVYLGSTASSSSKWVSIGYIAVGVVLLCAWYVWHGHGAQRATRRQGSSGT